MVRRSPAATEAINEDDRYNHDNGNPDPADAHSHTCRGVAAVVGGFEDPGIRGHRSDVAYPCPFICHRDVQWIPAAGQGRKILQRYLDRGCGARGQGDCLLDVSDDQLIRGVDVQGCLNFGALVAVQSEYRCPMTGDLDITEFGDNL